MWYLNEVLALGSTARNSRSPIIGQRSSWIVATFFLKSPFDQNGLYFPSPYSEFRFEIHNMKFSQGSLQKFPKEFFSSIPVFHWFLCCYFSRSFIDNARSSSKKIPYGLFPSFWRNSLEFCFSRNPYKNLQVRTLIFSVISGNLYFFGLFLLFFCWSVWSLCYSCSVSFWSLFSSTRSLNRPILKALSRYPFCVAPRKNVFFLLFSDILCRIYLNYKH